MSTGQLKQLTPMRRGERSNMTRYLAIATVLLGLSGNLTAGELQIKLTVSEAGGVARKGEPACGGIPLPWGKFKKDQEFTVLAGGAAIPAQVIPLVVDAKGYLRWVLIDTQIDVSAKGKTELTLKTGKSSAKPAVPLKVDLAAGGVTVNTGKIKFTISKGAAFSLFTNVEVGGKKVAGGGSASYTDITNKEEVKTYKAGAPTSIEVFEAGPMRATVKVMGPFDGDADTKMRYIAWITAWAGKARVHVKYILANSNPDQFSFRMIKASQVALKIAAGGNGSGGGAIAKLGNVSVHDLYFKEKQPCKVEAKGGELLLRGIMSRSEASGKVPWISRDLLLVDSTHFSSQYVIDFSAADLAARANADKNVLHIFAPPAWYFETESLAVGKFGTQADEMKCYDTWKWQYDKGRAPRKPGRKMPVRRYVHYEDNHYDSEEDIVESLLLMYLRTGRRSFFKTGRAWANYNMDLQQFRTDGWRYKDGAVWWNKGGPSWGNKPQRKRDPLTGLKNGMPNPWGKVKNYGKCFWDKKDLKEIDRMSDSKQCYCHCYGSGLAMWFCLTGERDALEAAIDSVEQNIDSQKRSKGKVIGKANNYSRDFTRSCYLTAAVRLVVPNDKFVVEADNHLMQVYVQRPAPELRGLVPAPGKLKNIAALQKLTHKKGEAKMKEVGLKLKGGKFTDKQGRSWNPVINPHTWMYTYLSGGLECSYRQTGDEDVMDRCIGYGQAVAHVLFQKKHFNLAYGRFLVDFPKRGFAWDQASWACGPDTKLGEGVTINGYLATFHPDVCARAYSLTGEKFLKQRAYDFWWGGSHRGYNRPKMHKLGGVGAWVNINSDHNEYVNMTGRTFYEWSHPRKDDVAPAAVKDLKVTVNGDKATVSFTAPADPGGGKVTRYQVKCSDRKIVDYQAFLTIFNDFKEKDHCNWFLATNVKGEPTPKAAGAKESFTVTGVPAGAKFFAVRAFDDSTNRSAISNLSGQ
jgi:hypothetical protein